MHQALWCEIHGVHYVKQPAPPRLPSSAETLLLPLLLLLLLLLLQQRRQLLLLLHSRGIHATGVLCVPSLCRQPVLYV